MDLGVNNPKPTDENTNIILTNIVYLSLSFSLITKLGLRNIGRGCKSYLIDDEISQLKII
jgi:hypothetical protein